MQSIVLSALHIHVFIDSSKPSFLKKKLFAVSSSYSYFHSSNLLEPYWTELENRAANSRNSQFSEGQTFKEIVAVQCDDCIYKSISKIQSRKERD